MKISRLMPMLNIHGRTIYDEEKEALYCNWTCSGFTAGVTGTYLKIRVTAESDQLPGMPGMPVPPADWPCVGAAKEDELIFRHECRSDDEWLTVWQSGSTETAEIRILKLSENARGKLGILEAETDGSFFPVHSSKPVLEIVGDSITCGFGNEASNNSLEFHTSEENGWEAYGPRAARELGYEFRMVCESGIMAVTPEHPLFPMHTMDDIYEYTDELYEKKHGREPQKWNFAEHPSDIVVINLGTNDSNPLRFYKDFGEIPGMEIWFRDRYKEFIRKVRKANGADTLIVCALGSMDYYLYHRILEAVDELIAETGDQKLCCFEFIPINVMFEGYGAMGHPSAKTHIRMGKELAYFLRSKVNQ